MIPKIIHYCWFSGDAKPRSVRECIRSWEKMFPDYEIRCWDAASFDFDSVPFVQEAYKNRKWAFVSDYVRLYALYTEGGIYLDSDVLAFGRIDEMHELDFFTGIEDRGEGGPLYVEAAIMGSSKGNPLIGECLALFEGRRFVLDDGSFDQTPLPTVLTPVFLDRGWLRNNVTQEIADGTVIWSTDTIANSNCPVTDTVRLYHLNNRSWIPRTNKERAYKFFSDTGLLPLWNRVKRLCRKRN